jgi:hypothetical protein
VGANSPAECGDYFAWGEITTKSYFKASNYKWYYGGDDHNITKYNRNSDYGTVDGRTELELEDDAAYVNMGPEWRMPTVTHLYELLNNCTKEWTKVNGMSGYLFKSDINNRAIFFPATGWIYNGLHGLGTEANYWCRSYSSDNWPSRAIVLHFRGNALHDTALGLYYYARQNGCNVRAVHVGQE